MAREDGSYCSWLARQTTRKRQEIPINTACAECLDAPAPNGLKSARMGCKRQYMATVGNLLRLLEANPVRMILRRWRVSQA